MPPKSKRPAPQIAPEQVATYTDYFLTTIAHFPTFAESLLKIQTKDGRLTDFELNEVQLLLEEIIKDIQAKKRLIRLIVLKARRFGISTWTSGKFFHKTVTNPNRYAMIICHEPEATDFVFHMHKRFQLNLPDYIKPEEKYNNKKMLEFNNDAGTGLDSAIRVGTAGKEDFGSAQLIHYLHLSEMAKYPRHTTTNLLTSILQCVPDIQDSEIIFESTAKGVGGEFHDRYWASRYRYEFYLDAGAVKYREIVNESAPESNDYTSIFIPWYVFSEYKRPLPSEFQPTAEEIVLQKTFGLSLEQLNWRRWTLENKCNGDLTVFHQEYPATAEEAFISSSDSVFPAEALLSRIKACVDPLARYNCNLTLGTFTADRDGKFKVWEEPKAGREYVISADVAEGLRKGDASVADVVDVLTGKQVAHFHSRIPPDQFGIWLNWMGRRYNTAILAVERNMHGTSTIDKIQSMGYPKVYCELVPEPPMKPRKRYGWLTSRASKPLIIDYLSSEFRDNMDGIQCKETLEEMLVYKLNEDGGMEAEEGRFDDRVMSIAIAKFVRIKLPKVMRAVRMVMNSYGSTYQKPRDNTPQITAKSWT